jgi:antitoxin (DNA-binding transcriptional repressor) of toxin-antitoxin stability system
MSIRNLGYLRRFLLKRPVDLVQFLVYFQPMIRLNMHEAKTHLSKYLARLKNGETIILCRRNVPIAEIRSLQPEEKRRRPVGLAKDRFQVPPEFYEPLPEELEKAWSGET